MVLPTGGGKHVCKRSSVASQNASSSKNQATEQKQNFNQGMTIKHAEVSGTSETVAVNACPSSKCKMLVIIAELQTHNDDEKKSRVLRSLHDDKKDLYTPLFYQ